MSSVAAGRRSLVWIDSRQAIVITSSRAAPVSILVMPSDVPAHRRSVGHIRHDPSRHGGGESQTAADQARLEHRQRFIDRVAGRLEPMKTVDIFGPGDVPLHLARRLRESDHRPARVRTISVHRTGPLTTRQLVASWRALGGEPIRRLPRRFHGWRQGRMGKRRGSVRPASRDSRLSTTAEDGAILDA